MRLFTLLCMILFISSLAFGQVPAARGYYGDYGPYIPRATVPEYSLQSVSPSPVGATNATTGLVAGATNGTLSMVNSDTSSVHTEAMWYSGGDAPLTSPAVRLNVRPMHPEHFRMEAGERGHAPAASRNWTYFAAEETATPVEASASAKTGRKAARTITNQDIDQENQKTGTVKYDGKTEQIK